MPILYIQPKILAGILILFSIVVICMMVVIIMNFRSKTTSFNSQSLVQKEIEDSLKQFLGSHQEDDCLEIVKITPFEWDHLYIFGEHTSSDTINETLGFQWFSDNKIYVEELTDLLVFTKDQKVVEYVVIHGDLFIPVSNKNRFSPINAVFRVKEVDDPNRPKIFLPTDN